MTRSLGSDSSDDSIKNRVNTVKFLYSYGGKIVPRRIDGKLRYVGGFTRVLAVDRSITFTELIVKFGELCGSSMNLKCKLPSEDLDVLVSITSDEDLANVIGEYDRVSSALRQDMKIRAVLFPVKSLKEISPPVSPVSVFEYSASKSPMSKVAGLYAARFYGCGCQICSTAAGDPIGAGRLRRYAACCQRHICTVSHTTANYLRLGEERKGNI